MNAQGVYDYTCNDAETKFAFTCEFCGIPVVDTMSCPPGEERYYAHHAETKTYAEAAQACFQNPVLGVSQNLKSTRGIGERSVESTDSQRRGNLATVRSADELATIKR